MAITDKCVFANLDIQPLYKNAAGECLAQLGERMNGCCFNTARQLILEGQIQTVEEILSQLVGDSRSTISRREGINGALFQAKP